MLANVFLGIVIGVALCAYKPWIALKLRSLLKWDKNDKKKKDDKDE